MADYINGQVLTGADGKTPATYTSYTNPEGMGPLSVTVEDKSRFPLNNMTQYLGEQLSNVNNLKKYANTTTVTDKDFTKGQTRVTFSIPTSAQIHRGLQFGAAITAKSVKLFEVKVINYISVAASFEMTERMRAGITDDSTWKQHFVGPATEALRRGEDQEIIKAFRDNVYNFVVPDFHQTDVMKPDPMRMGAGYNVLGFKALSQCATFVQHHNITKKNFKIATPTQTFFQTHMSLLEQNLYNENWNRYLGKVGPGSLELDAPYDFKMVQCSDIEPHIPGNIPDGVALAIMKNGLDAANVVRYGIQEYGIKFVAADIRGKKGTSAAEKRDPSTIPVTLKKNDILVFPNAKLRDAINKEIVREAPVTMRVLKDVTITCGDDLNKYGAGVEVRVNRLLVADTFLKVQKNGKEESVQVYGDYYGYLCAGDRPKKPDGSYVHTDIPDDKLAAYLNGTVFPVGEYQTHPDRFSWCYVLKYKYMAYAFNQNALLTFNTLELLTGDFMSNDPRVKTFMDPKTQTALVGFVDTQLGLANGMTPKTTWIWSTAVIAGINPECCFGIPILDDVEAAYGKAPYLRTANGVERTYAGDLIASPDRDSTQNPKW